MAVPIKNTPIGLVFPIQKGNMGYFDQSLDTFTAYRMNIINLLRTHQGERRMNPAFGSRLWTLVFEQNDTFLPDKVGKIIREDIARWIPGVTVSSVDVKQFENDQSTDLRDIYKLYVIVTFVVDAIKQQDVVQIVLNVNKV